MMLNINIISIVNSLVYFSILITHIKPAYNRTYDFYKRIFITFITIAILFQIENINYKKNNTAG